MKKQTKCFASVSGSTEDELLLQKKLNVIPHHNLGHSQGSYGYGLFPFYTNVA